MISVIVPVYQVEPFLHQCIDSIIHQTYRDFEILLIDDGSPDKCGEICDEYAKVDSRVRVFHTKNQGLSAARNFGLQEAKGDYIGFVDSDDWIEPEMYEVLLCRLEETDTDISVCEMWIEHDKRCQAAHNVQDCVLNGKDAIKALIFTRLHNGVWNKLYKRKCWNGVGFPEGHNCEDVATLYKVILNANTVSCTKRALCHYRIRDKSVSHSYSMSYFYDIWNAFHSRYLFLCTLPEIKNDQECMDEMKYSLALVVFRTWRWACCAPKDMRDYDFLNIVSNFVRNNFSLFGEKKWNILIRIVLFLSRYVNDMSFGVLKGFAKLSHCIHFFYHRGQQI